MWEIIRGVVCNVALSTDSRSLSEESIATEIAGTIPTFPELFIIIDCAESEHVIQACHLLAIDAIPWALWVILAAECKQSTTPTTWTIDETYNKKGNEND